MIYDALREMFNILKDSDELNKFCKENLGGELSVFLGSDENNLTEIDNAPYIVLDKSYVDFKRVNRQLECDAHFYLFFCIYDEGKKDGVYSGVEKIDKFAYIARWEILKNIKRPVEFLQETIQAEKVDAPLRSYPVYTMLLTGKTVYKEE